MCVETAAGRLLKLSSVSLSASHLVFFITFPSKLFAYPFLVLFQYEFVQCLVNVLSKATASLCVQRRLALSNRLSEVWLEDSGLLRCYAMLTDRYSYRSFEDRRAFIFRVKQSKNILEYLNLEQQCYEKPNLPTVWFLPLFFWRWRQPISDK